MGEWEYAPGRSVRAMTYNGQVPGPTIEARVGRHAHRALHQPPRGADDDPLARPARAGEHGRRPALSQPPIAPGARFEYRFTSPTRGRSGTTRTSTRPVQMERGLYGAIVVRGASEPRVDAEGVLVLDDLLLDADGQIAPLGTSSSSTAAARGRLARQRTQRRDAPDPRRAAAALAHRQRRQRALLPPRARRGTASRSSGPTAVLVTTPRTSDELLFVPGDRLDVLVDGTAPRAPRRPFRTSPTSGATARGSRRRRRPASAVHLRRALPRLAAPPAAGRASGALADGGCHPTRDHLQRAYRP
jgi:FtsP/CotA-like multicopper oxidase with cupredoxin domain